MEGLLALLGVTREAGPLFVVAPAGSFTPLSTPTASGSPSDNDGAAFERCLRRGDRTAGVAVPLPCAQGVLRFRPALGAVADVHPGPVSRCQSRQSLSVMSVMSVVVSHVSRCQPVLKSQACPPATPRARTPRASTSGSRWCQTEVLVRSPNLLSIGQPGSARWCSVPHMCHICATCHPRVRREVKL